MICPEAIRLFDLYQRELNAFHTARPGLTDAGDYEHCFSKLRAARTEYWKHVRAHGCRTPINTGPDSMEGWLRAEMERAAASFNAASQNAKRLSENCANAGDNAARALARKKAMRIRREAGKKFKVALTRFSDYVLRGISPPSDLGHTRR